jgi:hypothetical protein
MHIRAWLHANIGVIDTVYLEHEAGMLKGICYCRCGYRASEQEWLDHLAGKIADAVDGELVVELPFAEAVS